MQVENCEPQVFLTIPALVILNGLETIVRRFAPKIIAQALEIMTEVSNSGRKSLIELEVLEFTNSGMETARQVK